MVLSIATKIVLNFVDFSILVSRLFGRGARIFLRKSSKFELLNRFVSLNHFKPFESIQMDTKTLSVQILNVQIKTKPSLCFQFFSFDHSNLLLIRKVYQKVTQSSYWACSTGPLPIDEDYWPFERILIKKRRATCSPHHSQGKQFVNI